MCEAVQQPFDRDAAFARLEAKQRKDELQVVHRPRANPQRPYSSTKRRLSTEPKVQRPKKRAKWMKDGALRKRLATACHCKKQCLEHFSLAQIRSAVSDNLNRSERDNKQWLSEYVQRNTKNGEVVYKINDIVVCRFAFLKFHAYSIDKLQGAAKMAAAGNSLPIHFRVGGARENAGCAFTVGILAGLFNAECDKLVGGHWILPGYLDVAEITSEVRKAWSSQPAELRPPRCPSETIVRSVMKSDFKNVVSPLGNDWGICNVCVEQRFKAKQGALTESERTAIQNEIAQHRMHHKEERKLLERTNTLTQQHPEQFSQILIDMTRSAWLPHLLQNPKVGFIFDAVAHPWCGVCVCVCRICRVEKN